MSSEQIAEMAPDEATLERALAIARPKRWPQLAMRGDLLWGECRTRGALSYRCFIDRARHIHYCNCPSRKHPCKHVLSLLYLHLQQPAALERPDELPDWIEEWKARATRSQSEAEARRAGLQRAQQRSKTRDQRLLTMQTGAEELEQWLLDMVRQGLAQTESLPDNYWEEMAARMVDAKLGAIARRIRRWPEIFQSSQWPERLLAELAELYLFARGVQRLDSLPEALQQTLLTLGGLSTKKADLRKQPGVEDHWLIIGLETGAEEALQFRRTWLIGAQTGRTALLLDFAYGEEGFENEWKTGMALRGTLAFYPGNFPLRAVVKTFEWSNEPYDLSGGYPTLAHFSRAYAEALSAHPWLSAFPALLNEVIPMPGEESFVLVDSERKKLVLEVTSEKGWKLVALGAGAALRIFGTWNGYSFLPLSAVDGERLVAL